MRANSLLYKWFLETFKGDSERIKGVERLLRERHFGLAESAVCKALRAEYGQETEKADTATKGLIKVKSASQVYYL